MGPPTTWPPETCGGEKSVKGRTGEVPFTCTSKLFESTTAGSPEKEKGEEGLGKSERRPAAGELLQTPGDTDG